MLLRESESWQKRDGTIKRGHWRPVRRADYLWISDQDVGKPPAITQRPEPVLPGPDMGAPEMEPRPEWAEWGGWGAPASLCQSVLLVGTPSQQSEDKEDFGRSTAPCTRAKREPGGANRTSNRRHCARLPTQTAIPPSTHPHLNSPHPPGRWLVAKSLSSGCKLRECGEPCLIYRSARRA